MARQSCPSAQDAVFVYWHGCCLRGQCPRSPPSPNEESAVSAERHGDPAVPRRAATRLRAGTTPGVATFAPLTKSWRRGNIWDRNTFLRTTPSTLPRPDAACAPCARFEACQVTCAATPGHPRHVSAKDAKRRWVERVVQGVAATSKRRAKGGRAACWVLAAGAQVLDCKLHSSTSPSSLHGASDLSPSLPLLGGNGEVHGSNRTARRPHPATDPGWRAGAQSAVLARRRGVSDGGAQTCVWVYSVFSQQSRCMRPDFS